MSIIKFPSIKHKNHNWYTKRLQDDEAPCFIEWDANLDEFIGDPCKYCNISVRNIEVCPHCNNTKKLVSISIDSYIDHGFKKR